MGYRMTLDGFSDRRSHSRNSFSFTSKKQHPTVIQEQFFSQCLRALAPPAVSSLVCIFDGFLQPGSFPSDYNNATPTQKKALVLHPSSPAATAFIAFTPNFLHRCSGFLTFFLSAPAGIWLLSLPLSPKPWPPPDCQARGLLLQVLTSDRLSVVFYTMATHSFWKLLPFSHGPHHPSQMLSPPSLASGARDVLSSISGGLAFFPGLLGDLVHTPHGHLAMN